MAKITYTNDLFDFENLSSFDADTFKLKTVKDDSVTFIDGDGAKMVLHGSDIEKENGKIVEGEITSAEFYNADGEKIYTFAGIEASAKDIYTAYSFNKTPNRVMHGLMQGDDTVNGSVFDDSLWGFAGNDTLNGKDGDDYLYGHTGDDTLTGGKGDDRFTFLTGSDHDTVTDFDVSGSDHDYIYMDYFLYDDLKITKDGANLLLELPTGDQLTIEDVKKSQLTEDFFDFF
jgi:Ca2+-binding RTX toxin-like protein